MKTITGLYVWSANVSAQVADDATDEQQREALDHKAMEADLDFKNPVLHECSNLNLVD